MLRLHDGLDYTLYKIYLVAGLILLMGTPIIGSLILGDSAGEYGIYYLACLTGWLGGIFAYWWWVFLFKDNQDLELQKKSITDHVPPLSTLRNLNILHQAMSIHGGDVDQLRKARWTMKLPILEFYGWQNILVLWIFGFVWGGVLEIYSEDNGTIFLAGLLLILATMIIRTYFLVGRSAEGYAATYLMPLGLTLVETQSFKPQPFAILTGGQMATPRGAAVLEGRRRERTIHIEILDTHTLTYIREHIPSFSLHSPDGKLIPKNEVPDKVKKAMKGLRKAKRWKGIKVTGGKEGITVERDTQKQNMWLYDLWLAEYLLERIET